MSARPQDPALDELRFMSDLHRVSEADLDARIAERQSFIAPELRNVGERAHVRTATGIVIGGAYTRPPELPTADGELVQRALLADRDEPHVRAMWETHRASDPRGVVWCERVTLLIFVLLVAAMVFDWLPS